MGLIFFDSLSDSHGRRFCGLIIVNYPGLASIFAIVFAFFEAGSGSLRTTGNSSR
jgi:hypothetical protein